MKLLNDILTENDNETYCPGRLLWVVGTLLFYALITYDIVVHGNRVDPQALGIGFGGVLGGGGAGLALKSRGDKT